MTHPEQIVSMVSEALALEARPSDAAALLVDAAAMIALEARMDLRELTERLRESHETLAEGKAACGFMPSHSVFRQH